MQHIDVSYYSHAYGTALSLRSILIALIEFIPAWLSNNSHYNARGKVASRFPSLNVATVEFEYGRGYFPQHFTVQENTYPFWD